MVEGLQKWLHCVADLRMVVNPAACGIDVPLDRHFDLKTVSVHPATFMALRGVGQGLCGFKTEVFGQARSHVAEITTRSRALSSSNPALRGAPDEFVHLKLKTDLQVVGQNPFDNLARIDSPEDG